MKNKSECCGCTACEMICPVGCITMESDEEGFLYPLIDKSKCIECKKCDNVCPIKNPIRPHGQTKAYVGYSEKDEIRLSSSSGGIFSLIAGNVLKQNGAVFGVAFDENMSVCHICAQSEEELLRLRGSKYVQSRMDDTYKQVKMRLEEGVPVLFSGTACQVAGLKKYLGNDPDNLFTLDVLCHGVPSPKIWNMYVKEQEKKHGSSVCLMSFRCKSSGWKNYSVEMRFQNGDVYSVPFFEDKFMNMFQTNIDLRPSCHDCRFKSYPRVSDITIGDCWRIDKYMPEMDDDRGTSVILVHTEKGSQLFEKMQMSDNVRIEELDPTLPILEYTKKSAPEHRKRKKFWAAVQSGKSFDELHKYTKKNIVQKAFGYIKWLLNR